MTTRAALLALSLVLALAGPAAAQSADQPPQAAPPAGDPAAPMAIPDTGDLLDALAASPSESAAEALEQRILSAWLQSGSDTVDLLMQWSIKAMQEKNFPLALELLNEVVILKPDFAEGWNKRATVYYLIDEYALSLADIRHVLALEPRHFGALSGLGLILKETGDKKHALDAFRKALAVHPYLTNARKVMEELQIEVEGRGI
ncbi:MAG: hypothetical protein AB7L41_02765 [Flavobacteriaceae bacterium]